MTTAQKLSALEARVKKLEDAQKQTSSKLSDLFPDGGKNKPNPPAGTPVGSDLPGYFWGNSPGAGFIERMFAGRPVYTPL